MRRVATAGLAALVLTVLFAWPAYADDPLGPREGAEPGDPLNPLTAMLLYVVLPLAVVGIITMIVWLPGAVRANRYRPNRPWTATPVWFAGPADPVVAVRTAQTGDMVRGGASGDW